MKDIRLFDLKVPGVAPALIANAVKNSDNVGPDAIQAVLDTIEACDRAWAATVDGEVACIWGLHLKNIALQHAYIFLHLTKVGQANGLRFARKSKELIDSLAGQYRYLYGHLDPRKLESQRWLKWLGFQFYDQPQLMREGYKAKVFWRGER